MKKRDKDPLEDLRMSNAELKGIIARLAAVIGLDGTTDEERIASVSAWLERVDRKKREDAKKKKDPF